MKVGSIYRAGEKRPLAHRVWKTGSALEKMRGLLWRPELSAGEGMLLHNCGSVHTFGMGYPLDVVFLDKEGVILKMTRNLPPRRISGAWGAAMALELPADTAAKLELAVSERLVWVE